MPTPDIYRIPDALSAETVKREFSFIKALFGESEVYHQTDVFDGQPGFCDVYFKSIDRQILDAQVATYNSFKASVSGYIGFVCQAISNDRSNSEPPPSEGPRKLVLDVIEVPFQVSNYDLALICSKPIRSWLGFRKIISYRAEFLHGRIQSVLTTKDSTKPNDGK